ncbi:GH36-type glycosyl hydrolase domain-containing protein [Pseudophaeobacter sp.]|uniref:GH36-type glycosyl hydrolase domain-containing protein n=1 Tax=Pseudophaeobacter sp. TaxID=1971739 RepID=UPI003A97EFAB
MARWLAARAVTPPASQLQEQVATASETQIQHNCVDPGPARAVPVWKHLDKIPAWLDEARRICRAPPPEASKAAEWLLDNEYHVRRAVRQVREDMPPTFYRRLARSAMSEAWGGPRAFLAARSYVDETHAQIDAATATAFVNKFQGEEGLSLAELWAFPVMLRLVALEEIVTTFCCLVPELAPPIQGLDRPENWQERDPTDALSRAIVALAAIERIDWKAFVEATSHVEAILRRSPDGLYPEMDFDTRDRYRQAIEVLADGTGQSEPDIAREAVRMSRDHTGSPRQNHIGWWLVDGGRAEFEALTGYRGKRTEAFRRLALRRPGWVYVTGLVGVAALAFAIPFALLITWGASGVALALGGLLLLMPASIIAVTVTNWLVTQTVPPRGLPKMDFQKGLPEGVEAAVIVPAIFRSPEEVPPLLAQIERHMLTNPDPQMRYALLSDPADATQQVTEGDQALEAALVDGIRELNRRYEKTAPFVLLHRRRSWNQVDGIWMGWERKRGKIEAFNDFLDDGGTDAFPLTEGDVERLRAARYIVTLDADTIAPPGVVHSLIGALAHPLNRAEFDKDGERVIAGYTFIQPRIEISPEAGAVSPFTRLYTGDTAIDIYSRAVSDVYQDLFGEGIFTGKGAYDAQAFRRSLRNRVPENALVSHDLFEGLHGRAALATDLVLYEGFPARYPDFARRMHRWIRGDWQLLPWLGRQAPGRSGDRLRNPLSALDRWKIVDNLRRSLIAPSLVLLALCGWLVIPEAALIWTLLTVAAPGSYLVTHIAAGISRGRRRGAVQDRWRQLRDHVGRWLLEIAFMANEAVICLDAICRALWRLTVSRRNMLEWSTAAHVAATGANTRARFWIDMAGAPLLGLAITITLAVLAPAALPGALPLLVLWILSPEIAYLICRPWQPAEDSLSDIDVAWLRHIARRTWAYFETFAGPEDNWLAPDNYQTDPEAKIAHRSSPTNIGMQFLSSITALDLGHVGLRDLAQRTEYTLEALERIERHQGHLVNWFDTRTLLSLEPRYVSTVDSGNLSVSLLTLREGFIEVANGPALSRSLWDGFIDTLGVLAEATGDLPTEPSQVIGARIRVLCERAEAARDDPAGWRRALCRSLEEDLPKLSGAILKALDATPGADPEELHFWFERSRHHAASFMRDLDTLCPWLVIDGWMKLEEHAGEVAKMLCPDMPLAQLEDALKRLQDGIEDLVKTGVDGTELQAAISAGQSAQVALRDNLLALAQKADGLAMGMDFTFLYDRETRTFFIGYNLSFDRMDDHRYDLLASEARLASFVAIAKGDVPAEHWFHLGRPISRSSGPLTVLSWSGSMFEFLMPALLIRSAPGQLLGQSEQAAVDIQRRYGDRLGLPWGVSEAAFSARDTALNYQYRAFGVAGLGMRQGLAEDYVVAPYASALALSVRPGAVVRNLRRLEALGIRGRYGFYDAVDFTPSRLPETGTHVPVFTYMAHHQGMLLSAIGNALNDSIFVRRFSRDPRISAIDLLMHERVPWEYIPEPLPDAGSTLPEQIERRVRPLHGWPAENTDAPQVHTLGNGHLSIWLSSAATGSIWRHGQSLTSWGGNPVSDNGAARLLLRDAEDGATWEFRRRPEQWMDVMFHAEKASFHLQHHDIAATQEICVAAADDVEIRRVTLVNHDDRRRVIDVTTYAEPVLAPHTAHERHPAFSKLFVRSEILSDMNAVYFTRRPRRPEDAPPVMLHRLLCEDRGVVLEGTETDRRALVGRHGTYLAAANAEMTGTTGWTLDPVAALRARASLAPGQRTTFAFLTIAAGSRQAAIDTAERYATAPALDWAFEDAARSAADEANRVGLTPSEMAETQRLATHLLRPPARSAATGETTGSGQPDLWGLGVSGDLPIMLVRVAGAEKADLLPFLVRAQRWLRRNGLRSDLVVLGTKASSYEAPIAARLRDALRDAGLAEGIGGDGGIHLHSVDRISRSQVRALETLARVTLDGAAPTLDVALPTAPENYVKPPVFSPGGQPMTETFEPSEGPKDLIFDNGLGGFIPNNGDYFIQTEPGLKTPVPWCNVIANDKFGTIVTESGLGFTWSLNSGEFRLTPWSNDPVSDTQGEAVYLRDEETARIWTVTPLPAGDQAPCRTTHRAGETVWQRFSQGLTQRLSVSVPKDAPVKLISLELTNTTDRPRRITATCYADWQLGATPSIAKPHVRTGYHDTARALIAQSSWSPAFADQIAFLTASRQAHAMTCDRDAFLGPGGTALPEGLRRWSPWGRTDTVEDACAAYQLHLDIAPGATEKVVFVLGAATSLAEVETFAETFASPEKAAAATQAVADVWQHRLGAIRVETPDEAFDLMVNRWLPYQSFASRILARAGFQQASGGVGFRDQLQDMMAFLLSEPHRVRAHILDCAGHQFEEGDVLHWWHPPEERGVRTRCSDDMLWLVYATHAYVRATGDTSILTEQVPFLSAPPLAEDEEDRYAAFEIGQKATLLDHCLRAMQRGATKGAHGLPLIGSGDWNDGMDRVGCRGRGESVWLAWFAAYCGDACADLADLSDRADEAGFWRKRAGELRRAAEACAWDGEWYIRAFDDDGVPWGSAQNDECQIDSIAQSWAVLAGAPNRARAEQALRSAVAHLIDPEHRLVRLLTPAFDKTPRDPGYIRAYPPGVRENGGQYTHAAAWFGLAFARLGDGDEAYRIFNLINPARRSTTLEGVLDYRGEPYIMPADVGGAAPFEGRAGWTWYTGAAAWGWRLAVEGILGLELRGGALHIAPCLPSDWTGYRATVRGQAGSIAIEVQQVDCRDGSSANTQDGKGEDGMLVEFPTDGSPRQVHVQVCRGSIKHTRQASARA